MLQNTRGPELEKTTLKGKLRLSNSCKITTSVVVCSGSSFHTSIVHAQPVLMPIHPPPQVKLQHHVVCFSGRYLAQLLEGSGILGTCFEMMSSGRCCFDPDHTRFCNLQPSVVSPNGAEMYFCGDTFCARFSVALSLSYTGPIRRIKGRSRTYRQALSNGQTAEANAEARNRTMHNFETRRFYLLLFKPLQAKTAHFVLCFAGVLCSKPQGVG